MPDLPSTGWWAQGDELAAADAPGPQTVLPGGATGEVEDIPQGQAFAIVRTHYVSTNDAYTVIARAMTILHRTGRTTTGQPTEPGPARDLLVDVQAVMDGAEKMRSVDVLHQLRAHWEPPTVAS